jgi:hypothetical protein
MRVFQTIFGQVTVEAVKSGEYGPGLVFRGTATDGAMVKTHYVMPGNQVDTALRFASQANADQFARENLSRSPMHIIGRE